MEEPQESPLIQAVRQRIQKWIIKKNCGASILDLSRMNITELPANIFAGCSKLEFIALHDNQLTELPVGLFAECPKLAGVYLNNNQLIKLPADLFTGCPKLYYISLIHNQLTELPVDLFAGCSKLKHIYFDTSLIYHVLWSLHDFNISHRTIWTLKNKFPFECALVKRYRRVANDPRSYAWSVRRFAVLGLSLT